MNQLREHLLRRSLKHTLSLREAFATQSSRTDQDGEACT